MNVATPTGDARVTLLRAALANLLPRPTSHRTESMREDQWTKHWSPPRSRCARAVATNRSDVTDGSTCDDGT